MNPYEFQSMTVSQKIEAAGISPADVTLDTYIYLNEGGDVVAIEKPLRDSSPVDEWDNGEYVAAYEDVAGYALSVSAASSIAGVGRAYLKAEIGRGNLRARKNATGGYEIAPADFDEWLSNPRRGSRGNGGWITVKTARAIIRNRGLIVVGISGMGSYGYKYGIFRTETIEDPIHDVRPVGEPLAVTQTVWMPNVRNKTGRLGAFAPRFLRSDIEALIKQG